MIQKAVKLDEVYLSNQTWRLKTYLEAARHRWIEVSTDPRKKDRLQKQECLMCFYGSHIAGAAMTQRPCANEIECGEICYSGSTRCAILCIRCATKLKVCTMCGAKMDTRPKALTAKSK
jgi:hypothetical protein